jgi:hypothetical protein
VPAILANVDPDVRWVNVGPRSVPYARERRGLGADHCFTASCVTGGGNGSGTRFFTGGIVRRKL